MRSNTTRTAASSTTTNTGRQKDNDVDSDCNSYSNSRSKSNSNSKSTSYANSNSRTNHSNSHSNGNFQSESQLNSNALSSSLSERNSKSNARSLPSVVLVEGDKSVFAAMIGRIVKHTIFPKKQFLIFERELDENSKVAETCVQELKIEQSKWYSVKNLVRIRLNRVRNNAQLSVRKKLYSKSVVWFVPSNWYLTGARANVQQGIYQNMV